MFGELRPLSLNLEIRDQSFPDGYLYSGKIQYLPDFNSNKTLVNSIKKLTKHFLIFYKNKGYQKCYIS